MKIINSICARCGKGFDFELYNGLCPYCGCFHRSPGVSMNVGSYSIKEKTKPKAEKGTLEANYQKHVKEDKLLGKDHSEAHKTSYSTSRTVKKNSIGLAFFVVIWVLVVFSVVFSVISEGLGDLVSDFFEEFEETDTDSYSLDVDVITDEQYTNITDGNYFYYVSDAYDLGDSHTFKDDFGVEIPEDKRVIAVYYNMQYSGDAIDAQSGSLPYIYNGQEYSFADEFDIADAIKDAWDCEDEVLDRFTIFDLKEMDYGYCFYLVDEDSSEYTAYLMADDEGYRLHEVAISLSE